MRYVRLVAFLGLLVVTQSCLGADEATKSVTYADGRLSNGIISVAFDYAQGSFSILDAQSGEVLLSEAQFGLPSGKTGGSARLMTVEDVQDRLGRGKRIILEVVDRSVLRYYERAIRLFSYTLYDNSPALVFGFCWGAVDVV